MKKKIICALTVLLLAGCGNSTSLQENSGAMASSIRTKTSAAALSSVNGASDAVLSAPNISAKPFGKSSEPVEVNPTDFSDFLDFYEDGVPEEAVFPSLKSMEGSWKYYLDRQNLDTEMTEFNEFGIADVSLNVRKETVKIVLHPRMAGDGYELYPETEEEVGYEPFEGGLQDNMLVLEGNDVDVYIYNYFAWSGREYVMGEIWYEEGYWGLFLMTRGQQ